MEELETAQTEIVTMGVKPLAWQLDRARIDRDMSKGALAKQMRTSRTQVDRVLDPRNVAISLETLERAARALGKQLEVRLVEAAEERSRVGGCGKMQSL